MVMCTKTNTRSNLRLMSCQRNETFGLVPSTVNASLGCTVWTDFRKLSFLYYWIGLCSVLRPRQYRLYGRRFLQVKRPNQQYQTTEGKATTIRPSDAWTVDVTHATKISSKTKYSHIAVTVKCLYFAVVIFQKTFVHKFIFTGLYFHNLHKADNTR